MVDIKILGLIVVVVLALGNINSIYSLFTTVSSGNLNLDPTSVLNGIRQWAMQDMELKVGVVLVALILAAVLAG